MPGTALLTRRLRRAIAAGAAVPAIAFGPVGFASAATNSASAAATCDNGDAKYTVIGYLYGDGGHSGGDRDVWHFHNGDGTLQTHFAACAKDLGGRVDESGSGVELSGVRLDIPMDAIPPALVGASDNEVGAFVAATVEGEGSNDGKVLDDPDPAHCVAMKAVLARIGIGSDVNVGGSGFCSVWADRADWDVFNRLPFVDWSRVPGH